MRPRVAPPDGRRVVLVDDDDDLRFVLAEMLRARGFRVLESGDVASALAAIRAEPPDVVVTDYAMPGGSGLDLLSTLRGEPGLARIGAVVVSADADPRRLAARVAELRAGFVAKPFEIEDLLRAIDLEWVGE